jgi:heptaprenyl diphosphate synthase
MAMPAEPQEVVPHLASIARRRPGADHVPPRLHDVTTLIQRDMTTLERWLDRALVRDSSCACAAADLVRAGGKRLRPALVLLASRIAPTEAVPSESAMRLAAGVEMLHAATLLHDDVIDEAPLRRGKPTARCTWGNPVSVIAGDLLLVRALSLVQALDSMRLDRLTTDTLQQLVLGEVEQLERRGRLDMDVDAFERVAMRKTASLFGLAAVGGGMLSGAADHTLDALRDFATFAGLAFQLDDDLLDLCASPDALGKAIGQDLETGSVTLPVADVLDQDPSLRTAIAEHVASGEAVLPAWIGARLLETAHRTGALDRSRGLARTYGRRASDALTALPSCSARRALETLVELLVWRAAGQHDPSEARRYEA